MKENVKMQNAKAGGVRLLQLVVVLLPFAFFLFPFALASRAHEPITTKVRFNKELVRILQRNCLSCHHPGGLAFSLATYDEARPWAKAIKEEVLEKRMPPWHAVKGYGEFSNAPALTQRDIDLIVNWVEGGAPKGDEKDLPSEPLFSNDWSLGKPDLILKPEAESAIAPGADEYRTFTLSTSLQEDRWLTAIDVLPGNASVLHCATVYLDGAEGSPQSDAAMMQVKSEASESRGSSDVLRNPAVLAVWIPGQKPAAFQPGTAQLLPAGVRLAVKLHYRGSSEPAKDLSSVGLYFSKTPPRRRVSEIAINTDAMIAASTQPQRIVSSFTAQADTEAIAIRPSSQPSITSLQATAYRPDGSQEVLIWVRGHQSDWQPTYYLKRAAALPKGTRVEIIAYVDGSDENSNELPKPVRWSDISNQPLCTLLTSSIDVGVAPR
jgi:mono/diheme cytochrome c family protein